MSEVFGPWDLRTCCCPSSDPRECLEFRFGHTHFAEGECCTCICHDEYESAEPEPNFPS